jgi:hypothetical protein
MSSCGFCWAASGVRRRSIGTGKVRSGLLQGGCINRSGITTTTTMGVSDGAWCSSVARGNHQAAKVTSRARC